MVALLPFSSPQAPCWIPRASILDCVLKYLETALACCEATYICLCIHQCNVKMFHVVSFVPENDFVPSQTLRSDPLQALQVIVFNCKKEMMSVTRDEKSNGWKVSALTGSSDHFCNMRLPPIAIENATLFTLKPLENFKLAVPTVWQRVNTHHIVWVTGNSAKHALLVNRATHAHEKAQEIKVVSPGCCCRASLFAPLARRILVSEPLDEVEVSLGGRKLHDILLALCHVPPWCPIPIGSCRYSCPQAVSTACLLEEPFYIVSRDGEPVVVDGWARESVVRESKQRRVRGRRGYLPSSTIVGE